MIVSAPFSGGIAKSLASPTKREITPPLWSPKRVATKPGCRQLAVTPVPCRRRARSRVNLSWVQNFWPIANRRNRVWLLMRGRSCADDARRRGGQEPFAQPLGDYKIRHMIQRECAFEAIFGESAVGEHRPRVIDQDVDARFLAG